MPENVNDEYDEEVAAVPVANIVDGQTLLAKMLNVDVNHLNNIEFEAESDQMVGEKQRRTKDKRK